MPFFTYQTKSDKSKIVAQYDNLFNEINQYEMEIEELEGDKESTLSYINELTEMLDDLIVQIRDQQDELSNIEKKLTELKSVNIQEKENRLLELGDAKYQIEEQEKAEIQLAFKNYVLNMKQDDIFKCILFKQTSTVKTLDDFFDSGKSFMLIHQYMFLSRNRKDISLILTPRYKEIDVEDTNPPTMTEVKKYMHPSYADIGNTPQRLLPLNQAIDDIDNHTDTMSKGEIFLFDRPFILGGQTSKNRTGYGWQWFSDGSYIEGTLYGEVTRFMVVGFIVD